MQRAVLLQGLCVPACCAKSFADCALNTGTGLLKWW